MSDIPLNDAMLCWNSGINGGSPAFKVIQHPDRTGQSDAYESSVGACFTNWRELGRTEQKLKLLVEAWHIVAFYGVPMTMVQEGLLVIPEYRDLIASDCLPRRFQHERSM